MDLTPAQRDTIIRTVLGEAWGQSDAGIAAVAHVIANRAASGQYPSDPAAVATQHNNRGTYQFTAWSPTDGNKNVAMGPSSSAYQKVGQIVDGVFSGRIPDPTRGALNYYNPALASPTWGPALARINDVTIGNHRFVGSMSGNGASSQPDVRSLQQQLAAAGFNPGPVDGIYGPQTRAAVTAYQSSAGLTPDGVAGPITRNSLSQASSAQSNFANPYAEGTLPGLGIFDVSSRANTVPTLASDPFSSFNDWLAPFMSSSISDAQLAASPQAASRRADLSDPWSDMFSAPASPIGTSDITNSAAYQAAQRAAQQASSWYSNPSNSFIADVANQGVAAQQARDNNAINSYYANGYNQYVPATPSASAMSTPMTTRTLSINAPTPAASQSITKPAATLATMGNIFDLPQATAIPSATFANTRAAASRAAPAAAAQTTPARSVTRSIPMSAPAAPQPSASPSVSGSYVTNTGTSPAGTDWWQSSASDSTMGQPSLSWTTSTGGTVTTWTDSQGNEWTSYG